MLKLTDEDIRAIAISQVLIKHDINPDQLFFATEVSPATHQALAKEICERIDKLQKANRE